MSGLMVMVAVVALLVIGLEVGARRASRALPRVARDDRDAARVRAELSAREQSVRGSRRSPSPARSAGTHLRWVRA